MSEKCDHRSVGVIIRNGQGEMLLIERAKEPWGWAAVSGHVDNDVDEQGKALWEVAVRREVKEEVGLELKGLKLVASGVRGNACRRAGGEWHEWSIFVAESDGEVRSEQSEVKRYKWMDEEAVKALAERTERWKAGKVSEKEWKEDPGLEGVWQQWFEELGVIGLEREINREVGNG